jgi:hypothetical protein
MAKEFRLKGVSHGYANVFSADGSKKLGSVSERGLANSPSWYSYGPRGRRLLATDHLRRADAIAAVVRESKGLLLSGRNYG